MNSFKLFLGASLALLAPLSLATAGDTSVKLLNADFNKASLTGKQSEWQRINFHPSDKATVEWQAAGGVDNSGCIKIQALPENGKVSMGVSQKITGLIPNKMYRMKASVKTENVKDGRGAVIFDLSQRQLWNASKFLYGTGDWQEVYYDFYSNDQGEATLVCALGYRLRGTSTGGISTGTAWFDNVTLQLMTPEDYLYVEGEHIVFCAEKGSATEEVAKKRVEGLDKIYTALVDYIGCAPYKGRKIVVIGTPGMENGYWALAGNPILLRSENIAGVINSEDAGFGLVHEMGHDFNGGGNFEGEGFTSAWNWNDEIFANFRAYIGFSLTNSPVNFHGHLYMGSELKEFYKTQGPKTKNIGPCYANTFGAGKSTGTGDAYTYILIRLGDDLGWDVMQKMLRDVYKNGKGPFKNNWERFDYLISTLQKYTDKDVRATFPAGELDLIKEDLGGNK